ncbi:recombinase family protein [Rhodococcus opacus]|nr:MULTISPECIES: recombinase family protein [Rhodococcus]UOT04097.1 recombinase family protein [Rhodococcus opacus]
MSKNLDVGISTQVDRLCQNFSADQNPDHQVDALRRAGVAAENIHVDHAGGTKASRPELVLVLKRFRGGDVLVITGWIGSGGRCCT